MWGIALAPQDAEQQRAERRAVALQALGLGSWSYDLRQGRLEWDDRMLAIYGVAPGDFGHRLEDWTARLAAEGREAVLRAFWAAVDSGELFKAYFEIRRGDDGARRVIRGAGSVLQDEQGQAVRIVGAQEDITDWIEPREQLEAQRHYLEHVLDSNPNPVFVKDSQGRFTLANTALAELFGRPKAAILGQTDHEIALDAGEAEAFRQADREVLLSGRAKWVAEERVTNAEGRLRWFKTQKVPLWPENPLAHREVLGIATDITALKDQEAFARQLPQSIGEGVFSVDGEGRFTFLNPAACRMLGLAEEAQALGANAHELTHHSYPDGTPYPAHACPIDRVRRTGAPLEAWEDRFWRADGTSLPVLVYAAPLSSAEGGSKGVVVSFQDLSERFAREQRYRLVQEAARFGIWEWDLQADAITWDAASWRMLGYAPEAERTLSYAEWQAMVHPDDLAEIEPQLRQQIARGEPVTIAFRYRCHGGDWLWVQARGQVTRRAADGSPASLMGVHIEIEQLKATEQALALSAVTDHLTGLHNRQHFEAELDRTLAQVSRYGRVEGLLLFDVDHFKAVNDTYGHTRGDRVLIEIARRIQGALRRGDLLARWGGEEFTVLLPETDEEGTRLLAERLRAELEAEPFPEVGVVSISVGATQLCAGDDPNSAVRRVDQALYAAKADGRNRAVYRAPPTGQGEERPDVG